MFAHTLTHEFAQLVMLLLQIGVCAAPFLGGVARELVTVDREMSAAEQSLLVLRIDRGLSWSEVASVMSTPEERLDSPTVAKRFQRVKDKLRRLAEEAGLLKTT